MAVDDVTHLLDKEDGSAFEWDNALFGGFEEGSVFHYESTSFVQDMKTMLQGPAPDPKAQTLESVLSLPIRRAPFYLKQGRARKEVYDRIHRILFEPANNGGMTTPMNLIVAQMCGAIVYKKSFFEKVWTADKFGGRTVGVKYKKIAWRPPATCAVERDPDTGAFMGFRQMPIRLDNTEEKKFKPMRSFVYIHGTHRDPMEGVSDLHVTHWCYQTKQKIRFLWYQFLEGQSLPKTIVRSEDETEANNAAKKLIGLRQGGVVGMRTGIETDPLESSGRGAAEFKGAMQWLDGEASGSVLAGFTDLTSAATSGIGSFALSKDATDFFSMSREADKMEMQDYINNYLIADLVYWNFGPDEISPTFEFGPISQEDMSSAVSLLQATAQTPVNQSVLPQEFFDELCLRVAGFLELDVVTVKRGLDEKRKQAEDAAAMSPDPAIAARPEVAGTKAVVDSAFNAVTGSQKPPTNANQAVIREVAKAVNS
jgi:hypothetical protein